MNFKYFLIITSVSFLLLLSQSKLIGMEEGEDEIMMSNKTFVLLDLYWDSSDEENKEYLRERIEFLNKYTELDVNIPDEAGKEDSSMSFNTLKSAQALGDYEALKAEKRRVIRFHLDDPIEDIAKLFEQ